MDPRTALENAMEGDPSGAYDLREWLRKGGWTPRVQLHPGTDWWMRGARYGSVIKVALGRGGMSRALVDLEVSGASIGKRVWVLTHREILEVVR